MLSLYIHLPWCIQKCPYCDFNSHNLHGNTLAKDTEQNYINAVCTDLVHHQSLAYNRPITSIFFGGGTPSLFSPHSIDTLLTTVHQHFTCTSDIEITLEANPGTVDQTYFSGYRQAGINRLSLGIQSFNNQHLNALGRIHNSKQAEKAYQIARNCGFNNINLDLMYALPKQTLDDALTDLKQAISLAPEHISWYQLTLEPNTPFSHRPPPLPTHDEQALISEQGQILFGRYQRYEISAYCLPKQECQHNLNYWQFGDYLGVGAGAHSKITHSDGHISRHWQHKHPKQYISNPTEPAQQIVVPPNQLPFEFMLNALRLEMPISIANFTDKTGLSIRDIEPQLQTAKKQGFLYWDNKNITLTKHGKLFYNECVSCFLTT